MSTQDAQTYVDENLVELCKELVEWDRNIRPRDGYIDHLITLILDHGPSERLIVAGNMIEWAAVLKVAGEVQ